MHIAKKKKSMGTKRKQETLMAQEEGKQKEIDSAYSYIARRSPRRIRWNKASVAKSRTHRVMITRHLQRKELNYDDHIGRKNECVVLFGSRS